jgi:predicted protein tyrosine phosphatase
VVREEEISEKAHLYQEYLDQETLVKALEVHYPVVRPKRASVPVHREAAKRRGNLLGR